MFSLVFAFNLVPLVVVFQEGSDIITFETLSPSWNEVLHAWTLKFNGRVKIPSKKNFLVSPEKVGGSFTFPFLPCPSLSDADLSWFILSSLILRVFGNGLCCPDCSPLSSLF